MKSIELQNREVFMTDLKDWPIPNIDSLIECDNSNCKLTKEILHDFSPQLIDVIDQTATLFSTANRVLSQGVKSHFNELQEGLKALNIHSFSQLQKDLGNQDYCEMEKQLVEAAKVMDQFFSRETRVALVLRTGVQYAILAADILRMRLTGPFCYLRIQCESIGLVKIMCDKPWVARQWRTIKTDEDGRSFYRKYQSTIKSALKSLQLAYAYDSASNIGMHSRCAGMAFGLQSTSSIENGRIDQEIRVNVQEYNPFRPEVFITMVLHILRTQELILSCLPVSCPEFQDELFIQTRIPEYRKTINSLFELCASQYPPAPPSN